MGSDNPRPGKRTAAESGGLLLSMFKGFGLCVVLVAVAVGTTAKFKPTLFFKIPHVGFIPWAISGGVMPPYMWPTVFAGDNHKTWLKVRLIWPSQDSARAYPTLPNSTMTLPYPTPP